jgi:hypothetical protein
MGRRAGLVTKSNLILGMGETRDEVSTAMRDLHEAGCDLLTITQYLRPSPRHHPVERWVKPQEFVELSDEAEALGFAGVLSGPLVRSSYRAGRLWAQAMRRRGDDIPAALSHLADYAPPARRRPACWPADPAFGSDYDLVLMARIKKDATAPSGSTAVKPPKKKRFAGLRQISRSTVSRAPSTPRSPGGCSAPSSSSRPRSSWSASPSATRSTSASSASRSPSSPPLW